MRASKKRVHAIMKAHGLVLARDSEPGEPTRGHVAVPEPNLRFATDFTMVWTKEDGIVAVVPAIDCGCRSILGLEVTKDQQGPAVVKAAEDALVAAFGCPEKVPSGLSSAPTMGRSTPGPTARSSSSAGASSTPPPPSGGRRATR